MYHISCERCHGCCVCVCVCMSVSVHMCARNKLRKNCDLVMSVDCQRIMLILLLLLLLLLLLFSCLSSIWILDVKSACRCLVLCFFFCFLCCCFLVCPLFFLLFTWSLCVSFASHCTHAAHQFISLYSFYNSAAHALQQD
jgi:hypothetical protein